MANTSFTVMYEVHHKEDSGDSCQKSADNSIGLLQLPEEILYSILNYLSYDEMSKKRLVCKRFNQVCQSLLNKTFTKLQHQMLQRFQKIKNQMPRRESARRKHPMARECDIIETLHMRLTLLQMTFGKHIERSHCCFFAGEILDEIYRILRYMKTSQSLGRAYKVTDELFDLSAMAKEYFKECIEPRLPEISYFSSCPELHDLSETLSSPGAKTFSFTLACDMPTQPLSKPSTSSAVEVSPDLPNYAAKLSRLRGKFKQSTKCIIYLRRDMKLLRAKVADQQRQITEYNSKLEHHDRKFEEQEGKFNALLQEFQACKNELIDLKGKESSTRVSTVQEVVHNTLGVEVAAIQKVKGEENSSALIDVHDCVPTVNVKRKRSLSEELGDRNKRK